MKTWPDNAIITLQSSRDKESDRNRASGIENKQTEQSKEGTWQLQSEKRRATEGGKGGGGARDRIYSSTPTVAIRHIFVLYKAVMGPVFYPDNHFGSIHVEIC